MNLITNFSHEMREFMLIDNGIRLGGVCTKTHLRKPAAVRPGAARQYWIEVVDLLVNPKLAQRGPDCGRPHPG
jgi:hypothetical protein